MQNDNANASKAYTVPKAIMKQARLALIEKAQEDTAKNRVMMDYYKYQATLTTDTKEIGELGMQADKLEQKSRLNVAFLQWIENAA